MINKYKYYYLYSHMASTFTLSASEKIIFTVDIKQLTL